MAARHLNPQENIYAFCQQPASHPARRCARLSVDRHSIDAADERGFGPRRRHVRHEEDAKHERHENEGYEKGNNGERNGHDHGPKRCEPWSNVTLWFAAFRAVIVPVAFAVVAFFVSFIFMSFMPGVFFMSDMPPPWAKAPLICSVNAVPINAEASTPARRMRCGLLAECIDILLWVQMAGRHDCLVRKTDAPDYKLTVS